MGRIINRSELAEYLGISLPTVDQWVRDGMPCVARPTRKGGTGYQIDLGAVLDWHRERERVNALGDVSQVADEELVRRKRVAELAIVEHELAIKVGSVVTIQDAVHVWSEMIAAARAKFLGIGNKIGPRVAALDEPVACQSEIDLAVHEALSELAQYDIGDYKNGAERVDEPTEEIPVPPVVSPAETNRKSVGGRKKTPKPRGKRRTRKVADK